jgi:von Willebrand factor type A domain.
VSKREVTAGNEDGRSDPATGSDSSAESIREQYAAELAAESEALDEGATRLDALEGYIDALGVADTDAGLRVVTDAPDTPGPESGRWARASRDATRLARRFQSRLQEQRRDSQRSHCRRGTFDRSRLLSAARGQLTVFQQHEEGGDKRYSCIVVLDRSGSMDNGAVRAAERGALTAGVALDTVGVSVTMLDLHDSEVRLIKTQGENPREARDRVLTEQASGGTPLADALSLVRARFRDTENPFVIVVTDGQPDDGEMYLAHSTLRRSQCWACISPFPSEPTDAPWNLTGRTFIGSRSSRTGLHWTGGSSNLPAMSCSEVCWRSCRGPLVLVAGSSVAVPVVVWSIESACHTVPKREASDGVSTVE